MYKRGIDINITKTGTVEPKVCGHSLSKELLPCNPPGP